MVPTPRRTLVENRQPVLQNGPTVPSAQAVNSPPKLDRGSSLAILQRRIEKSKSFLSTLEPLSPIKTESPRPDRDKATPLKSQNSVTWVEADLVSPTDEITSERGDATPPTARERRAKPRTKQTLPTFSFLRQSSGIGMTPRVRRQNTGLSSNSGISSPRLRRSPRTPPDAALPVRTNAKKNWKLLAKVLPRMASVASVFNQIVSKNNAIEYATKSELAFTYGVARNQVVVPVPPPRALFSRGRTPTSSSSSRSASSTQNIWYDVRKKKVKEVETPEVETRLQKLLNLRLCECLGLSENSVQHTKMRDTHPRRHGHAVSAANLVKNIPPALLLSIMNKDDTAEARKLFEFARGKYDALRADLRRKTIGLNGGIVAAHQAPVHRLPLRHEKQETYSKKNNVRLLDTDPGTENINTPMDFAIWCFGGEIGDILLSESVKSWGGGGTHKHSAGRLDESAAQRAEAAANYIKLGANLPKAGDVLAKVLTKIKEKKADKENLARLWVKAVQGNLMKKKTKKIKTRKISLTDEMLMTSVSDVNFDEEKQNTRTETAEKIVEKSEATPIPPPKNFDGKSPRFANRQNTVSNLLRGASTLNLIPERVPVVNADSFFLTSIDFSEETPSDANQNISTSETAPRKNPPSHKVKKELSIFTTPHPPTQASPHKPQATETPRAAFMKQKSSFFSTGEYSPQSLSPISSSRPLPSILSPSSSTSPPPLLFSSSNSAPSFRRNLSLNPLSVPTGSVRSGPASANETASGWTKPLPPPPKLKNGIIRLEPTGVSADGSPLPPIKIKPKFSENRRFLDLQSRFPSKLLQEKYKEEIVGEIADARNIILFASMARVNRESLREVEDLTKKALKSLGKIRQKQNKEAIKVFLGNKEVIL